MSEAERPAEASSDRIVDAREISPRVRHTIMFQLFGALAPGEFLQVINDHDPQMLRSQLELRFGEAVAWTYVEQGPDIWRVRIGRR